jgi:tetratricopeptide (TPR) repeat protein
LPGTKLGLKEVIEVTRSILNIYPSHVSGDIVADGSEKSGDAKKLKVTIYLTQNGNRGLAATISGTSDNVDGMAKDVAKAALRLINPYILATYEYGQNQFEDASGVLEEMIRSGCGKDREHAVAALNLRGLILLSQTKFATAENTFKQANDCKKTSIAYTNLGTAQLLQQNYEGAIASYRQAVYLDPKNADTHNALAAGLTLGGNNHFDEAVTEYEKAIELDGNKSLFYNDLGTAFAKHRDYEKAFADFQRATDLNPNDASIYENWGLALYQAGRYGEAAEKYEKIIELDTHNSTAYQDLGLSLLQLKKFNDAASRFAQAANLDPKNPAIYKAWSNALEGEGRKVEAKQKRAIAQRLIEKKPT